MSAVCGMRRRGLCLVLAVGIVILLPSKASAAAFGFGDLGLATYGDTASFHTLCGWNGTSCGHGGLNIKYARLFAPYNALGTYDSSTASCVSTSADPNNWIRYNGAQTPTSQALRSWLTEAQKDGLRPMITITWGNGHLTSEADNPSYPTQNGYRCGLEALMNATGAGWNLPVHEWEVFNEPEGGLCSSDAAGFFAQAQQAAATEGRSSDTLVAGAFKSGDDPSDGTNHPDCGHRSGDWFIRDYVQSIKSRGLSPTVWSWHPYGDVDASYAGASNWHQTGDLTSYLNQQFATDPQFWLTEVGVVLTSPAYGPYLDGSSSGQANAAQGFKLLGNAPHQAYSGQISRIYWYEFQTYGDGASTGSDTWDSALLGLTRPDWLEDGTGVPRASYCVLAYGDSPTRAVSDSRCDYASTPHVPWTDWQNPNDPSTG
jgi:hypothetical protein